MCARARACLCESVLMSAFACVCVCWHPIAPGSCPVPNEIKKDRKKEGEEKKRELEIDRMRGIERAGKKL